MKQFITPAIIMAIGLSAATPSYARTALSADARINKELTAAAVADKIRNECPTISARMVTAISKAMSLKNYAMGLGYSSDEIDEFINNKSERGRIFGLRDQYLAKNGVSKGDEAAYCKLGEKEISSGSLIGSILRKN